MLDDNMMEMADQEFIIDEEDVDESEEEALADGVWGAGLGRRGAPDAGGVADIINFMNRELGMINRRVLQ